MAKKLPTKADKLRWAIITELGCVVCQSPTEIHHLTGAGMGRKAPHHESFGLCANHHRHGGLGVAIHAGVKTWEKKFGYQRELLEKQNALIEEHTQLTGN